MNALNFRNKSQGGLGLINPVLKARALLIKSMYREYTNKGIYIVDVREIDKLYGFTKEFIECLSQTFDMRVSRNIYTKLLEKDIFKNGSLIPSRAEKKL